MKDIPNSDGRTFHLVIPDSPGCDQYDVIEVVKTEIEESCNDDWECYEGVTMEEMATQTPTWIEAEEIMDQAPQPQLQVQAMPISQEKVVQPRGRGGHQVQAMPISPEKVVHPRGRGVRQVQAMPIAQEQVVHPPGPRIQLVQAIPFSQTQVIQHPGLALVPMAPPILLHPKPFMNPNPVPNDPDVMYVNARQYKRILERRKARAKLVAEGKIPQERPKYLHESRHRHATNRFRNGDGTFATGSKNDSGSGSSCDSSPVAIKKKKEQTHPQSQETVGITGEDQVHSSPSSTFQFEPVT